jgi:hypothetical protein
MSESKSASVVFTNGRLLAKNAQKKADNAKSAAEKAQELAYSAQKTADGKNRVFRGSDPATVPTSGLQEGDLYFTDNALYTWTGSAWEKTVSDTTGAEIHAKVEAAMQESQKAVADLKSNVEAKVKNLDDEIAKNKIQTGNALSFYKEQYYLSTSYTELTGGSWSDEVPPRKVEGKYVWSRYVTANVGDPTNHQYSDPVCISGLDGEQGPQGPQGLPSYTHIAYANSADGKTGFDVSNSTDKTYIGVYVDSNPTDSTDPTKYKWTLIKGADGADGVPGPKGADGRTPYFHTAWAYSADEKIGFTTVYPNINLFTGTSAKPSTSTGSSWNITVIGVYKTPEIGQEYTLSVEVPNADHDVRVEVFSWNNAGDRVNNLGSTTLKSPGGKGYITFTWPDPGNSGATQIAANLAWINPTDTGTYSYCKAKLEKGDTATLWMPSASEVTTDDYPGYIGQYTDFTQADSTNPSDYTWSLIRGKDGAQGTQGPTGATGPQGPKGEPGQTGFFIGTTPPPNPAKGTVWATTDSSGNMNSAKKWNGSTWVSTAFTQDLVAGNISATKIVGGELDVNKITVKNAQNIPVSSTVSLGDKLSSIEQDAGQIKLTSMAGQGLDLVDGLDGEFFMGGGIPITTWKDGNAYLALPISVGDYSEALPQTGTQFATLYNLEAGKTYTQSIIIETDAQINPSVQPQWTWFENGPVAWIHNIQPAELISLGNNCYRLIGSYTPNGDNAKYSLRILDIWNFTLFVNVTTGTYLKFRSPHFFCADDSSLSQLKLTSDSLNAYVKGSKGSKTLEAILSMDPDHSSIAQVVNGQIAAAIGTYSDGTVRIDGKALYINAQTKIDDATIKSAMIESIEAEKIKTGTLNADKVDIINLNADKIASGTLNGMTITGSTFIANTQNGNLFGKLWDKYQVVVENAGIDMTGSYTIGNQETQVITTLTGGDLYVERITNTVGSDSNNWTKSIDINTDGPNPYIKLVNSGPEPGRYASTYVGSDAVQSDIGSFGKWNFNGYEARADGSLYIANSNGTNFDGHGDVGFQVWSGIGLGKSTIYTPTSDLYIQIGNVGPALGQSYSSAGKVDVHCNRVISKVANTVSSRLSVKTDITPVSYDRALAAVKGTEMYDYRYIDDETGQHYVSGIIDDVNPDPQYHMDEMLINKERTARIDANLVGYHHVIIQKLLERVAALEEKIK